MYESFFNALYAFFKALLKAKKEEKAIRYDFLVLSLFLYGLSPSNTRPTKDFRARSEEGAKSGMCLFLYALYAY